MYGKAMSQKDGGWGWVVVVACFIIGMLYDGLLGSYGLMFVEFLSTFKESRAATAGIGSLMFGMTLFAPLAGLVTNRFGCQVITVIAGVVCSVGYIAASLSTRVVHLYLSIGVLSGVGFLLLEMTRHVIIIQYFDKRRSLALGLSLCGSGIGGVVFNPLVKWLIDRFGWRGALLIEGGLTLNFVACGLLMRPLSSPDSAQEISTGMELQSPTSPEITENRESIHLNGDMNTTPDYRFEVIHDIPMESGITSIDNLNQNEMLCDTCNHSDAIEEQHKTVEDILIVKPERATKKKSHRFLNLQLLKQRSFHIFFCFAFFYGLSYYVPQTFIPDLIVTAGGNRYQATWLLTVTSISNGLLRIPIGCLMDRIRINRVLPTAMSIALSGLAVAAMAFSRSFTSLVVFCIVFGCLIAGNNVLGPLMVADVFGDDMIAESRGMGGFAFGIGNLIAGPIVGALVDATGSYTVSFITFGAMFVLSGLMLVLLYMSSRREKMALFSK